jgi:uncharacterized membrane protein YphA (DoxX/SURF4 family)
MNDFSNENQRAVGMFFLRCLLGLILLMQGWGKVFTWGIQGVYDNVFKEYETTWIPVALLRCTAYVTSYVELLGGLLLLLGLLRQWTYIAIGFVLLIVSYGHGLTSPIWDLQHVFFRAALLISLFLLPMTWDKWSVDQLLKK